MIGFHLHIINIFKPVHQFWWWTYILYLSTKWEVYIDISELPNIYEHSSKFVSKLLSTFSLQISRQSIDAVKDHFRDEMTKPDWQLIMEMKKLFQILWKSQEK